MSDLFVTREAKTPSFSARLVLYKELSLCKLYNYTNVCLTSLIDGNVPTKYYVVKVSTIQRLIVIRCATALYCYLCSI